MDNNKAVDILNKLIEINNDRIEGYDTASKETEELDLKQLIDKLKGTSEDCNQELIEEVLALNGTPTEGTKTTGKFFRAWMDVKAALSGKDRKVILDSCEFGEDNAVATYDKVIKNDLSHLSSSQIDMVQYQRSVIKKDHDEVRSLRDSAKLEKVL